MARAAGLRTCFRNRLVAFAALALAGAMIGFTLAGLFADYPQPLVGHGASAILGYGLALALLQRVAER